MSDRAPIRFLDFEQTLHTRCEICGKGRRHGNHKKCSKIRQQRGFSNDPKPWEQKS